MQTYNNMSNTNIADLANVLGENEDFVIIAHISPDADTLGSALALCNGLQKSGKRAVVVCDGDGAELPDEIFGETRTHNIKEGEFRAVCAIAVDCADEERMGKASKIFNSASVRILIDHHKSNTGFGDYVIIDPEAAATAELVYKILIEMDVDISKESASLLYHAILGDTGGFAYSNTTSQTFDIAAKLLSYGVPNNEIYDFMFRNSNWVKVKMLGYLLSSCERYHDGRVCMGVLDKNKCKELNAFETSSDGLVEHLRDIKGVLISIYIRQLLDGSSKISLRSKDMFDVAKIAMSFDGGGHRNAAGFSWNGDINEISKLLVQITAEILN